MHFSVILASGAAIHIPDNISVNGRILKISFVCVQCVVLMAARQCAQSIFHGERVNNRFAWVPLHVLASTVKATGRTQLSQTTLWFGHQEKKYVSVLTSRRANNWWAEALAAILHCLILEAACVSVSPPLPHPLGLMGGFKASDEKATPHYYTPTGSPISSNNNLHALHHYSADGSSFSWYLPPGSL